MKIVQITAVPYGSTGKIARGIADVARQQGHEVYIYYSWTKKFRKSNDPNVKVGSFVGKALHIALSKITGYHGVFSRCDTKRLIAWLDMIRPDVLHLHIMHCWYINLPMLFDYIKRNKIRVVWTFHDTWAFTGHCAYFQMVKCEKWKNGCCDCPQYKTEYPAVYVDRSQKMWQLKKEWFTGVDDLTVVTPSEWLAELVKTSMFKEYPVKVINNGIDLDIFKPTESDFRRKYACEEKFIILGVALGWSYRKGLDVVIELSKRLDSRYQIVLVGTDDDVDKLLPDNIISIHRTQNQKELAEIYSAADVFINPTREDNFPTVNLESLACGTPVITFKTGGSPECIDDTCGAVVECGDVDAMEECLIREFDKKMYSSQNCVARSMRFDMRDRFFKYVNLY